MKIKVTKDYTFVSEGRLVSQGDVAEVDDNYVRLVLLPLGVVEVVEESPEAPATPVAKRKRATTAPKETR